MSLIYEKVQRGRGCRNPGLSGLVKFEGAGCQILGAQASTCVSCATPVCSDIGGRAMLRNR